MNPKLLLAKLLLLSLDQSGKPEGILAQRKAEELMAKYGISKESILSKDIHGSVQERTISMPAEGWAHDLFASVAYFCACATVRMEMGEILIFGKLFHIEVASLFYDQIMRQLDKGFRRIAGAGLWSAEEINNWRASFSEGVRKRLQDTKAGFDPFGAVRDTCLDAAEAAIYARFPGSKRLERYAASRKPIQEAFDAGERVQLRHGIGISGRHLIADGAE